MIKQRIAKHLVVFFFITVNTIFAPLKAQQMMYEDTSRIGVPYAKDLATRDPEFKIQKLGVAVADKNTDFSRQSWQLATDKSILFPELPWEGECTEGASICVKDGKMWLFYAGAYNNSPQQIGVAYSLDGINFTRLSDKPFKPNGKPGEWNSSESGHPHLFTDKNHRTYLFYQGNPDHGKTWRITQEEVLWEDGTPHL